MILNNMRTFAFIRRIDNSLDFHYCGYVGLLVDTVLPPCRNNLKEFFGESKYLDDEISIHGGITYSGKFHNKMEIIPLTAIPENWYDHFGYGFDLNHAYDKELNISTNFEYAKMECLNLQKQLEELLDKYSPSTGN